MWKEGTVGSPRAQPGEGTRVASHLLELEGVQGAWCWNVETRGQVPRRPLSGVTAHGLPNGSCPVTRAIWTEGAGGPQRAGVGWGISTASTGGGRLSCVCDLPGIFEPSCKRTAEVPVGGLVLKAGPAVR